MSMPIDIPRRARSSLTSSSVSASPVNTPLGLYIPIHKRSHDHPSHIYEVDFLVSLRPTADESVRDKLRASCPEILMSRRIRKTLQFQERQRVHNDIPIPHDQEERQRIDVGIHRVPALPPQKQLHVPSVILSSQSPKGRVLPRRNSRTAIRPAERRRQAWQPFHASVNGTWRAPHVA